MVEAEPTRELWYKWLCLGWRSWGDFRGESQKFRASGTRIDRRNLKRLIMQKTGSTRLWWSLFDPVQ